MGAFAKKALNFDGINDYLLVGDVAPLKFDNGDAFTMALWINTTAAASTMAVIGKRDTVSPDATGYLMNLGTTGRFNFQVIDAVATQRLEVLQTSVTDYSDGVWHLVIVSKDTTEAAVGVTLTIDDFDEALSVIHDTYVSGGGTSFDTTVGFQVAGHKLLNALYAGDIGDVAVYNKELSSAEKTVLWNGGDPADLRITGPFANLVHYMRMGDGATFPTIPDDSTNSNDGTMTTMTNTDIVDMVVGNVFDSVLHSFENDTKKPVVTLISPPEGTPVTPGAEYVFTVVDNSTIRRTLVLARYGGAWLLVHDGVEFAFGFKSSSILAITGGNRYTIRRDGGWQFGVDFQTYAIDTDGNEAL